MQQYKITQIKSGIGRPERQKRTLLALGITRMNRPIVVEGSPQIMGMINKMQHLIKVEKL